MKRKESFLRGLIRRLVQKVRRMFQKEMETDFSLWWPRRMRSFARSDPMTAELVSLAEISSPFDDDSSFELFTGLVPLDKLDWVLEQPGPADWPLHSSGPHPTSVPSGKPWFRLAFRDVDIEPLVVSWETGMRRVLVPDQGFLMTYGLTPRMIRSENDDEVIYDDLTIPEFGIIKAKTLSHFEWTLQSDAYVRVRKDYLEDYSTIRDMAVVQFFFSHCDVDDDEIKHLQLVDDRGLQEAQKGRVIVISKNAGRPGYYCQVHGLRCIAKPSKSPIIQEHFYVEELDWPGISETITRKNSSNIRFERIYVSDDVLSKFEDRPDLFSINPETGSVSYGGQWSVGYCDRVGRDFISVELKKLYEGNLDHVIKHWHSHAVSPPDLRAPEIRNASNVAKRSKRIIEAIIELGQLLSELWSIASGHTIQAEELTGYDERDLRYHGFWKNPYLFDISKHISWQIGEDTFFQRCIALEVATIENLKENKLRKLIQHIGVPRDAVTKLRSFKLLYAIIVYAKISEETGLDIITEINEIDERRSEIQPDLNVAPFIETPLIPLFRLHDFRINAAHRGDTVNELLEEHEIDRASLKEGWGFLLDQFYDDLGSALESANAIIQKAISNHYENQSTLQRGS